MGLELIIAASNETAEDEAIQDTTGLRDRAGSLRRVAEDSNEVLAGAFRRRAQELELQAWLLDLRLGRAVNPVAA